MRLLGTVQSIHIAVAAAAPMLSPERAHAVPGRGLEGDRYFHRRGTYRQPGSYSELTLVEAEAIEALQRDYGILLEPGDSRRNIVTRGVPLNHLVGKRFRIGEVEVEGLRLCEPCSHLDRLTVEGVRRGLVHRGGLRAAIRAEGWIRVGDPIVAAAGSAGEEA